MPVMAASIPKSPEIRFFFAFSGKLVFECFLKVEGNGTAYDLSIFSYLEKIFNLGMKGYKV